MANNGPAELIVSTVAVVLASGPNDPPLTVGIEVQEILRPPLSVSQGPEGTIITSNRDQVEVELSGNKLNVRESSGNITQARSKVPKIVYGFLADLADTAIRSYGINLVLETYKERANEWLGNNFLNPSLASPLGTPLSSNLVALLFDYPPKKWTVRFQNLSSDRLNVNLNASESTSELPSQEKLGHEVEEQYEALKKFLSEIGL